MNCCKIITALLIALCFNCFSQHMFNASLGYGFSMVHHNPKAIIPGIDVSTRPGSAFMAGLGYKYQFKKLIGLGIDLSVLHINGTILYERQGTATWFSYPVTYKREEKSVFELNYITFPAYVNFYHKRFSLDIGFQGSYAFNRVSNYSDKFMYSNGSTNNSGPFFTNGDNTNLLKYDYGFFAALNFKAGKKLDVLIRYYKGLTNLDEYSSEDRLKKVQIIIGARYYFSVSKAKNKVPEKVVNP